MNTKIVAAKEKKRSWPLTSTTLPENKVVGAEGSAEGKGAHGIHGAGLKIDEDGSGNILVGANFIDALELVSGDQVIEIAVR
jgi:hypothetical protein